MVNSILDCGAGVSRSVDEKNQPQKLEFESYPLSIYSRANVQQREDARMHEAVPKGCIPCTAGMYAFLSARKLKKIVSPYCRYPSRIGFHQGAFRWTGATSRSAPASPGWRSGGCAKGMYVSASRAGLSGGLGMVAVEQRASPNKAQMIVHHSAAEAFQ